MRQLESTFIQPLYSFAACLKSGKRLFTLSPSEAARDISSDDYTQHKKASNHRANLPLEMYSFTL